MVRKRVITLRISPEMHAALRDRAHEERTSVNLLVEDSCRRRLSQSGPPASGGQQPTAGPDRPTASEGKGDAEDWPESFPGL